MGKSASVKHLASKRPGRSAVVVLRLARLSSKLSKPRSSSSAASCAVSRSGARSSIVHGALSPVKECSPRGRSERSASASASVSSAKCFSSEGSAGGATL